MINTHLFRRRRWSRTPCWALLRCRCRCPPRHGPRRSADTRARIISRPSSCRGSSYAMFVDEKIKKSKFSKKTVISREKRTEIVCKRKKNVLNRQKKTNARKSLLAGRVKSSLRTRRTLVVYYYRLDSAVVRPLSLQTEWCRTESVNAATDDKNRNRLDVIIFEIIIVGRERATAVVVWRT